ncbi:HEAT repeat domain-containing protein [Actinoplanes sp. CA-054009]
MTDNVRRLESVIEHASQDETDYEDIAAAVEALTASGDAALVPRLHEALDRFLDEENFYGRDLIASVLAGVAGVAALPVLLLAADRDLGDDQDSLRADIAGLMGEDPVAVRKAILELIDSDVPERRRVGLLASGSVGDAGILEQAARHPDADVRLVAVEEIPALPISAIDDPDEDVCLAAIGRLGASGHPGAVDALTGRVIDGRPRVRARIAYALGRLGRPAATAPLLRLLSDGDERVRDQARDALGTVGSPEAVGALLAEAAGPDARLRSQAAKALAKAIDADPRVVPRLTLLAHDEDAAVRAATLSGLATSARPSDHWAALAVALAADADPTVRQRVAVVAHHLAPGQAGDLLRRLAADPEAIVRETAATQAGRLRENVVPGT